MMAPEAPAAPDDYKIVIDTPNLRHLSLSDQCCITYNIINLSSLVSAHLCKIHEKAFLELLTHISHVKELVLNDISMIGGFHFFDYTSMPIFNDLIHLEMKFQWTQNSKPLFHLFKCTSNLVTLSLTLIKSCFHNLGRAWSEPHEVPQCFLSSIESVEIKWVGDSDQEIPMISYILKNAMVLKKLSLHYNSYCAEDLAKENKFLLTLLTLPRSSPIATCQVTSTRR